MVSAVFRFVKRLLDSAAVDPTGKALKKLIFYTTMAITWPSLVTHPTQASYCRQENLGENKRPNGTAGVYIAEQEANGS